MSERKDKERREVGAFSQQLMSWKQKQTKKKTCQNKTCKRRIDVARNFCLRSRPVRNRFGGRLLARDRGTRQQHGISRGKTNKEEKSERFANSRCRGNEKTEEVKRNSESRLNVFAARWRIYRRRGDAKGLAARSWNRGRRGG